MDFRSDGSITRPDPDVVTTLDDEDVQVTILALTAALREAAADFPEKAPVAAYQRALAKFERIAADSTSGDDET